MSQFIQKLLADTRENILQRSARHHYELLAESDGAILDVGCGAGHFLVQSPDRIVGLDGNPGLARRAGDTGACVITGDARTLPFASGRFGGVRLSHVIEHFAPEGAFRIISECRRVLKPGGFLLVATPLMTADFFGDPTHVRPYPPNALLMWGNPQDQTQNLQKAGSMFDPVRYCQHRNLPPLGFLGGHHTSVAGPLRFFRMTLLAVREALFVLGVRTGFSEYCLLLKKTAS